MKYAGVGSRETPKDVLEFMEAVAYQLAEGWDVRSGGAEGADEAFARGADYAGGGIEIYLPWPNFNGFGRGDEHLIARWEPQAETYAIAAAHHPAWNSLSQGGKALHARNVHQVLGYDIQDPDPSKFVLCWTPGGQGGGGTGQAIRIARAYGVPVFDLAIPKVRARVDRWIEAQA